MRLGAAAATIIAALGPVELAAQETPPVVPRYYVDALKFDDKPLQLEKQETENNSRRAFYAAADRLVTLAIQSVPCEGPACTSIVDNAAGRINAAASAKGGEFVAVSLENIAAKWKEGIGEEWVFVFRLPRSVVFWDYSVKFAHEGLDAHYGRVSASVDRQRYEEAAALDNVEIGRWSSQIGEHGRRLAESGDKAEALKVWAKLLANAPNNYQAQMDFAQATPDTVAARNAATAVLSNAEDPEMIARAGAKLGIAAPDLAALPELEHGERGLQLILVPLPPVDLRVVEEAAKVYEKITAVPTKIRRIRDEIPFGEPDRIPNERWARDNILRMRNARVDFTGWTKERYASELLSAFDRADALSRYWVTDYIEKLESRPGQYDGEPYLKRFLDIIVGYQSGDRRTMYVAVTEANIFSNQTNYVFSQFLAASSRGSLLSYAMMEAKAFNDPRQSRKRVAERLAKEMVPASLKSLEIPRPADPSDPYSYSDSVERLDQKTLELSPATKEALDNFRK